MIDKVVQQICIVFLRKVREEGRTLDADKFSPTLLLV